MVTRPLPDCRRRRADSTLGAGDDSPLRFLQRASAYGPQLLSGSVDGYRKLESAAEQARVPAFQQTIQ